MADKLDNLSIASATHLHSQGHITLGERNRIHSAVRRKVPTRRAYGSMAGPAQQAQSPIPAIGPGTEPSQDDA